MESKIILQALIFLMYTVGVLSIWSSFVLEVDERDKLAMQIIGALLVAPFSLGVALLIFQQ